MKKIIFFCVLLFMFCSSCKELVSYEEFVLKKTPYTGNELRIDGYYYYITPWSDGTNRITNITCLYRNGVLLNMGGSVSSLEEADRYVISGYINGSIDPNYAYLKWGLFVVNNKIIKAESYFPTGVKKRTYISEGKILNDTTFNVTVYYRSNGSERQETNIIYYFRQFSPKPDSTNNFIK